MTDTQSTEQPWDRAKRDFDICTRYLKGETLQTIAVSVSITAERARQIVRKAGLTVADRGRSVREKANAVAGP